MVRIGTREVGTGKPCFIIGEIGINHNGDVEIAKKLIDVAKAAGVDAVKFQKRTVEVVYTEEELEMPRESPFGETNGDLKRGLELGEKEYRQIDKYCRNVGMEWFASAWDEGSVDFIDSFGPKVWKIASASLTDNGLLRHVRSKGKPIVLSTGMSTMKEITMAVRVLGEENLILLHTTSTYPAQYEQLNLRVIQRLQDAFGVCVGYSGHETGIATSVAAVALGACVVERHITLDRSMWGSDQAASLEPTGLARMVRDIRLVESAMGDGIKRVYDEEIPVMKKLRRVGRAGK